MNMLIEGAVAAAFEERDIRFPEKLQGLFAPARYKVLYGGRDGGRSWGAARALLTLGTAKPLLILCAREIQSTLADSVHQLLKNQIDAMGLGFFYHVQDNEISGANGTRFIFAGLRNIDPEKVKSFEGVDIVWVEEAENLSKKSFNTLEPTIRKDDSELWFTFNPQMDSDFIYEYFVTHTPPGAVLIHMTFLDNPWPSKVLASGREHMRLTDHEEYENIWEGKARKVVAGAIYAKEMLAMLTKKRIRPMPYDPAIPVHTIWDLGWNDNMVVIFAQRIINTVVIIDYLEDQFKTYADWVKKLNTLPYVWGTDWLPHDGGQTHPETGKNAKQTLEGLGRKSVVCMPKLDIEMGIRAARMMFPRLYMDNSDSDAQELTLEDSLRWKYSGAARLAECLKRYKRAIPKTTEEPGRPIHDDYSHGADAFRGLAMIVDKMHNEGEAPPVMETYGILDHIAGM